MITEDRSKASPPASPITPGHDINEFSTTSTNRPNPGPSPLLSTHDLHLRVTRLWFNPSTGQPVSYPQPAAVDFSGWLQRVESDFKDVGIPQVQWSDATILLLEGKPNMAMRRRRQAIRDLGVDLWEWQDFCKAFEEVLVDIGNRPSFLEQVREEHPMATKVVGVGLAVAGGVVLAPAIVVGGLNAIGFTAAGVAGGSIAAGLQSMIYGGATTGLFSLCQSIGATAAAPAVGSVLSGAGALFAGATVLGSGAENNQDQGSDADGRDPEPENNQAQGSDADGHDPEPDSPPA